MAQHSKLKFILPPVLVVVGLGAMALLIKAKPEVETTERPSPLQLVRVMPVEPQTLRLDVHSQGTVLPRTETVLIPEVAAKVVALAPDFAAGGFFERGAVLVRLDPRDFELAVTQAQAQVAQAEVALTREEAEAAIAIAEWQELERSEAPPPLVRREPQLAQARAAAAAARAALARAELNLERTVLRAPFAGRVRTKTADVGQYVAPGQPLGQIYAIDYVEVRLPIPDDQLAYLKLPMAYRGRSGDPAGTQGPAVTLHSRFAGREFQWSGRIVRTEGEIDPKTRMIHLVARVDDPYARGTDPERPPLAVGMFVQAEIEGRRAEGVVVLPRVALRGGPEGADGERVLVLAETPDTATGEASGTLRFRPVEVLRTPGDLVLIAGGLAPGEKVCVSPLEATIDGMGVRTVEEPPLRLDRTPAEARL
jgi:RND family efflux transporter MFP subunit